MKFIIVAGGTGGHIFPALSLVEKILENKDNEVLYIGTTDRMESEIVPSKGIPLPFISYGGSAMLINCYMVGILVNIARSNSRLLWKIYL